MAILSPQTQLPTMPTVEFSPVQTWNSGKIKRVVILTCPIHEELQYHCWDESLAGWVHEFWLLFLQECGGQFQLFLKPPQKQMSTHTSCFITWRTSPSKQNFPVPQGFWNKYFALKHGPYSFKIRIPHRKQVHSRREAVSWVCACGIEWKM